MPLIPLTFKELATHINPRYKGRSDQLTYVVGCRFAAFC